MRDALSIAAASMSNDMQRVATLSNNLANATTPAFKRELAVSAGFGGLLAAPVGVEGGTPLRAGEGLLPSRTVTDHAPGALRATGNPLDVALEGAGFFEVMSPQGARYTRQGSFQLDAAGRLVNGDALPVMGIGGEITLSSTQPRIERDGRIFDGDQLAGQLRVVRFDDPRQLEKAGAGLYATRSENSGEAVSGRLRQGHLESSNVVTTHEMVRLIETMRHFEANQKVIHSYDEMLDRAIRALGEF